MMKSIVAFGAASVALVKAGAGCCGGHDHHDHGHSHDIVQPEATAAHILVKTAEKAEELKAQFAEVTEYAAVKELFGKLALENSECPSKENGGSLGHFEKGQMVPEFETVIFDKEKAIGQVHGPVETQFGQHLILIECRLNGDGSKDGDVPVQKKASASHILVDDEAKCIELKEQIAAAEDQVAEFAKVAAAESKCPSGEQAGGNLGSFRQGQMVPEFDSVIFGAEYGLKTVHGPIKTQFGHHLIFITERSGMEEEEESVEEKKEEEDAQSEASTEVPEVSEEPSVELSEEAPVEEEAKDEL